MTSVGQLHDLIDQAMEAETATFLATVPYASHLTDPAGELDEEYYLRHRVETVKRIRLTSRIDALALAGMVSVDYPSACAWGKYAAEEMSHDRLFLTDLAEHGVTTAEVASEPLLPATARMVHYLETELANSGPLAAVAYSLYVEWQSERYSVRAVEKARQWYSPRHVRGAHEHVGIDEREDHYGMLVGLAQRLLEPSAPPDRLLILLSMVGAYLRDYFRELYASTVGRRDADPVVPSADRTLN